MASPSQLSAATGSSGLPFGFGEATHAYDAVALDKLARFAEKYSEDPSTQNAAQICEAVACNRIPHRVVEAFGYDATYGDRAMKLATTIHAEEAAVLLAEHDAGFGDESHNPAHAYALWAACPKCAALLINHGVKRLVTCLKTYQATPDRWKQEVDLGLTILSKCGVSVRWFVGNLGVSIRFDGKELML